MLKSIKTLLVAGCVAIAAASAAAVDMPSEGINLNPLERFAKGEKIPLDSAAVSSPVLDELVIVGGDTVSVILPQKNYGRFDRGLFNFLFIPKGQWSFGIQASYGEFNTEDFQILSILK
ncbi:MAG: hypothetical protein K2L78_02435, partial [Muribaculaceae bacterium]|nr:hypothetical protein [Muribaculaceae bacterium]